MIAYTDPGFIVVTDKVHIFPSYLALCLVFVYQQR